MRFIDVVTKNINKSKARAPVLVAWEGCGDGEQQRLWFRVLSVATVLEMGIITVYSVLLSPPEIFGLGLSWTHILGHFSAYLVLFLLAYGVLQAAPQPLAIGTGKLIAFGWAFGYSVLMECLQLLIPLRQFEVEDLGLNLAGVMVGLVAISVKQGNWNSKQ